MSLSPPTNARSGLEAAVALVLRRSADPRPEGWPSGWTPDASRLLTPTVRPKKANMGASLTESPDQATSPGAVSASIPYVSDNTATISIP